MAYKLVLIVVHDPDTPLLRTQRVPKNAFLHASAPPRKNNDMLKVKEFTK